MPRIRVSLSSGELEVEGDEGFINQYQSTLEMLLERLASAKAAAPKPPAGDGSAEDPGLSGSFGEVLHGLPKTATGVDQILLAGRYAQTSSAENTFATSDANNLLVEQGIKLSNASQALKNNLTAKRVFKVANRYRVSKAGDDHLASLMKR